MKISDELKEIDHTSLVTLHEDQFRLALDNLPIGQVITDHKGKIVFVNKQMLKIFGYTSEELIGQEIEIFVPKKIREKHVKYRGQYNEKPTPRAMGAGRELLGVRKDGKEIPIEIGLTPFHSPQGKFIIAAIVDITEKKKLEGAVRSNRELEQFAYTVSHDLQAPLRHISSYIELLADKNNSLHDEESKRWISVTMKSVERMRSLIDDVLMYSRLEKKVPEFDTVEIQVIYDEVLEVLHQSIQESQAVITHDSLPAIYCIPNLIHEVFQNLLENALKFHRKGVTPRIHLSVDSKGESWVVSVKDNGIGMNPNYLDRIFIPFQRLHKESESPGTGIGLATVKKIIQMHGGTIWAESTEGEGTTFLFTIPKDPDCPMSK